MKETLFSLHFANRLLIKLLTQIQNVIYPCFLETVLIEFIKRKNQKMFKLNVEIRNQLGLQNFIIFKSKF